MKKILFLGLLSFLGAALWQLPATIAKPYAEQAVQGLKIDNVSGTIWQGSSQDFTINNYSLGEVSWKVHPIQSLTSLTLNTDFTINEKNISATGNASITPQKTVILKKTKFELDADTINQLQQIALISGDIKGTVRHAVIVQGQLPEINATIDWKNGAIISPLKLSAGDYRAIIKSNSPGLTVTLNANDAPMELNGIIKLNKEWLFDTDISIKSSDSTLGAMLGMLGRKQADGTINIKYKGDLKPFLK